MVGVKEKDTHCQWGATLHLMSFNTDNNNNTAQTVKIGAQHLHQGSRQGGRQLPPPPFSLPNWWHMPSLDIGDVQTHVKVKNDTATLQSPLFCDTFVSHTHTTVAVPSSTRLTASSGPPPSSADPGNSTPYLLPIMSISFTRQQRHHAVQL